MTEKELLILLQSMENNKSPGNYGLTKESYMTFSNEVKAPLLLTVEKTYLVKQLSAFKKQAVIKFIEEKDATKGIFKTADLFPYLTEEKTLKNFKLERGTRQSDLISAYLFIIVLEVFFQVIKETSNIKVAKYFRRNLSTALTLLILSFFLKILNLL